MDGTRTYRLTPRQAKLLVALVEAASTDPTLPLANQTKFIAGKSAMAGLRKAVAAVEIDPSAAKMPCGYRPDNGY